jgi:Flp pilus assembly protein TadD
MAAELDPLSVNISIARGICLFHARRFGSAIEELNRAVLLAEGDSRPHSFLGASWLYQNQRERAIAEYRRAVEMDPDNAITQAHLVFGLGRAGYREQAGVELGVLLRRKQGARAPFYTALAQAGVGDGESACHWLLVAENVRDENLTLLKVHPYCDPLRTEPCYRDLLQRMKLV